MDPPLVYHVENSFHKFSKLYMVIMNPPLVCFTLRFSFTKKKRESVSLRIESRYDVLLELLLSDWKINKQKIIFFFFFKKTTTTTTWKQSKDLIWFNLKLMSIVKTLNGYLLYMCLIKMNPVLNLYTRKLWANPRLTLGVTYLLYNIILILLKLYWVIM